MQAGLMSKLADHAEVGGRAEPDAGQEVLALKFDVANMWNLHAAAGLD